MEDITDNMSADQVWAIIEDILDSVKLAVPDHVYKTVADYVTNHYGE